MFDKIKFIITVIPLIIDAIKEIEKCFPQGGEGAEKLKLVKNILISIDCNFDKYWDTIQDIIGYVVTFCNNTGVFKK